MKKKKKPRQHRTEQLWFFCNDRGWSSNFLIFKPPGFPCQPCSPTFCVAKSYHHSPSFPHLTSIPYVKWTRVKYTTLTSLSILSRHFTIDCSQGLRQKKKKREKDNKNVPPTENRASPCSNWALLWPWSAACFIHFLAFLWLRGKPSPNEKQREVLYIARTYPPSAALRYHLACVQGNKMLEEI